MSCCMNRRPDAIRVAEHPASRALREKGNEAKHFR